MCPIPRRSRHRWNPARSGTPRRRRPIQTWHVAAVVIRRDLAGRRPARADQLDATPFSHTCLCRSGCAAGRAGVDWDRVTADEPGSPYTGLRPRTDRGCESLSSTQDPPADARSLSRPRRSLAESSGVDRGRRASTGLRSTFTAVAWMPSAGEASSSASVGYEACAPGRVAANAAAREANRAASTSPLPIASRAATAPVKASPLPVVSTGMMAVAGTTVASPPSKTTAPSPPNVTINVSMPRCASSAPILAQSDPEWTDCVWKRKSAVCGAVQD